MGELVVITRSLEGLGFSLAGAKVFSVEDHEAAADLTRRLMRRTDVSIVVIRDEFHDAFPAELKSDLYRWDHPLFVRLPAPADDPSIGERANLWSSILEQAGVKGSI